MILIIANLLPSSFVSHVKELELKYSKLTVIIALSVGKIKHIPMCNFVFLNFGAAEFAVKTNFLNPIYGIDANENFNNLETRIVEEIGRMPRSYAEVTYDEFWVAGLTLTNNSLTEGHNIDSLRDTFVKTAN
jgi:hypothetical protein